MKCRIVCWLAVLPVVPGLWLITQPLPTQVWSALSGQAPNLPQRAVLLGRWGTSWFAQAFHPTAPAGQEAACGAAIFRDAQAASYYSIA